MISVSLLNKPLPPQPIAIDNEEESKVKDETETASSSRSKSRQTQHNTKDTGKRYTHNVHVCCTSQFMCKYLAKRLKTSHPQNDKYLLRMIMLQGAIHNHIRDYLSRTVSYGSTSLMC